MNQETEKATSVRGHKLTLKEIEDLRKEWGSEMKGIMNPASEATAGSLAAAETPQKGAGENGG